MAGKGSKQRPTDQKKYADSWERIFGSKDRDLAYESDNPLERPYDYKYKQKDMTELNADGNEGRGRYGEEES